MARALENPDAVPRYLEYFGMTCAPFARDFEPAQMFHAEQYSLLYAHLSDATGHADRLLILRGADGTGKTTLLSQYTADLDHETSFASFDETCVDANQFYCNLLRQLGFGDITGSLSELRHIAREFLLHRGLAGDPVLLIIDNAHLVSPSILEQLRWLAEIKVEDHCVISLVLSGKSGLERIMASPAMRLLEFGHQVDFGIRAFTERETDDYVRHRIRWAGGSESVQVSAEARPLIHRFSGGYPGLINRLCNAVLGEALAQKTRVISAALVRNVADEHELVPHVLRLPGQGRRKSDRSLLKAAKDSLSEERICPRDAPLQTTSASELGQIDINIRELLAKVSGLSDELRASTARTEKALQDVDARDADIGALLSKIVQQSEDLEQAAVTAHDNAEEIEQLGKALRESRQLSSELNDGLESEARAAKKMKTELARASRKLASMERRKTELQASIREVKAEQKQRATQVRRDLKARDKATADLEQSLAGLQKEQESLRTRAAAADKLEEALREKEASIEEMRSELDSYLDEATATHLQLAGEATDSHAATAVPDRDAPSSDIAAIEIFRAGALDQVVRVEPGQTRLIIGRSEDNELCLKSKVVSRRHALIFLAEERTYIEDLHSYNGTIVNGKKVSRCDLDPDDTITIGDFELRPRHR